MLEVSCYRTSGDATAVNHNRCRELKDKDDADVERLGRYLNVDYKLQSDELVSVIEQHHTQVILFADGQ